MPRRIYIIPESMKVEDAIEDAKLANCPEIVHGIPPRLEGIIDEASLPIVFEEPEVALPEPPRSTHISVIDAIDTAKARPVRIKRVWQGRDYFYDCLVTESVKDQYLAGDVAVGDYILVHFDDIGELVVTEKVFKSW